jgi:DnaK suppressor protein
MSMKRAELEKYSAMLKAKHADLAGGLLNRDGIAIEKAADALDEVQLAGERELAIRNLDRESNLLRNVRFAMSRIVDGCYGTCLHCEEEISPRRLAAVPWTAYCIKCQEAADQQEFANVETVTSLVAGR